ncbi:3-keto-5-aminohexanoate cleavage protein [Bradyrhizobium sp. 49]|uniref:3-keto-5-aminohexanoate cleavage protein n=1 Tax=unclassified Bradyrhizobium TaxID=2631580 RepID=UPI001FF9B17E|nr:MULTISPECIES: 3-keto-5-aminohexanoate cleavage protein [unclassified Bradyrhizobium]MCK1268907.1 3-keto-5-aminohexanoate cleavage protein [Bradyrhizobium sp. 84]MCK1369467.1 3-keto-5-aminohexanoate cleavage protein [Bradyrhizobium sp. 49]
MSRKVVLTCAVTGASSAVLAKHPDIPKTPSQIAAAAIEAAKAGAAIVHIHVREPETGAPSNRFELYEQVVKRIRDAATDVIINLTCGMDSGLLIDSLDPIVIGKTTTLKNPIERCIHAIKLRPELATLDCGTICAGESIHVARMSDLREMATLMRDAGVKPELECFELGHIEIAKKLIAEGKINNPALFQFCLSTGAGAPAVPIVMQAMRDILPPGAIWAGFGCSADQMPTVAQMVALGGHIRVGLEDNIYLRRGVLASNAQLVENAVGIVERMGVSIATPAEAREILGVLKCG